MNPTEFDFSIQMPGDERLLAAIGQLAAHAAGYAQLTPAASEALALQVARATEAAIASSAEPAGAIDYRFTADGEALLVVLSHDVAPAARRPRSHTANGLSVEWDAEGTRHVCRIRQRLTGA